MEELKQAVWELEWYIHHAPFDRELRRRMNRVRESFDAMYEPPEDEEKE